MKKYKYTGTFKNDDGHTYQLDVTCNGYLEAFFLLTAKAISEGKHYQLYTIADEEGRIRYVDKISKILRLISITKFN